MTLVQSEMLLSLARGHLDPVEPWAHSMAQSTHFDLDMWPLDSTVHLVLNSPSLDILPFLSISIFLLHNCWRCIDFLSLYQSAAMLTIALISGSFLVIHVLGDCSIQPIYLDIHERSVEGGLTYGAYINVGCPEQELSLWPSLELNETTLADENFCTNSFCSASSAHGLFHSGESSS
jgi:hypothetical protein